MCIGTCNLEHSQISTLPLFEDIIECNYLPLQPPTPLLLTSKSSIPSYLLFVSNNFWHSGQLYMS